MNYFFRKILKPYIVSGRYKRICEIGASYGENTDKFLKVNDIHITVIDPCIDKDLVNCYGAEKNIAIIKTESLKALAGIDRPFDCIMIDGDHNWYTVYNELLLIHNKGLIKKGGTIFLHDMLWPYARRDMYYVPDTIPAEFRHPYAKKGMPRSGPELLEAGGTNDHLYNACHAGGPRNGVLTAAEDFLKEYGRDYIFFIYRAEYGLGFLIRKDGLPMRMTALRWRLYTLLLERRLAVKVFFRKSIRDRWRAFLLSEKTTADRIGLKP